MLAQLALQLPHLGLEFGLVCEELRILLLRPVRILCYAIEQMFRFAFVVVEHDRTVQRMIDPFGAAPGGRSPSGLETVGLSLVGEDRMLPSRWRFSVDLHVDAVDVSRPAYHARVTGEQS